MNASNDSRCLPIPGLRAHSSPEEVTVVGRSVLSLLVAGSLALACGDARPPTGRAEQEVRLANGPELNGAKLNGAKLNGAKLNGAKLNGAKLNGAKLNG